MSTRTIYAPLTTVFTAPASCRSQWTYEGSYYNTQSEGVLVQQLLAESLDTACYPTSFSQAGRAGATFRVYSPGVCPTEYATAQSRSISETAIIVCCPSAFGYTEYMSDINYRSSTQIFRGCVSTFAEGRTTEVLARVNNTDLASTTLRAAGPITMWAQPITIAYEQRDLAFLPGTTTAPSETSSTSRTSFSPTASIATFSHDSTSSTPAASSIVPQESSHFSPSGGMIGGIVGGALAVIGVLIGLAIFFWRKRSRKRTQVDSPVIGYQQFPVEKRAYLRPGSHFESRSDSEQRSSEGHGLHEIGQGRDMYEIGQSRGMRSKFIPDSPVELPAGNETTRR